MTIDEQYDTAIKSGNRDLGLELAIKQASSQGFSIVAYHGTPNEFNEFKIGDIGFHFSKDQSVAINRLVDLECEIMQYHIYNVALSIKHPFNFKYDMQHWSAYEIFNSANMMLDDDAQCWSLSELTMYEQKLRGRKSLKFLTKIGYSNEDISSISNILKKNNQNPINPLENTIDSEYRNDIREHMLKFNIDGILYENDYESDEGCDSTCYIVISPNQVKSIEPIYDVDNQLITLSKRFDFTSPKFR